MNYGSSYLDNRMADQIGSEDHRAFDRESRSTHSEQVLRQLETEMTSWPANLHSALTGTIRELVARKIEVCHIQEPGRYSLDSQNRVTGPIHIKIYHGEAQEEIVLPLVSGELIDNVADLPLVKVRDVKVRDGKLDCIGTIKLEATIFGDEGRKVTVPIIGGIPILKIDGHEVIDVHPMFVVEGKPVGLGTFRIGDSEVCLPFWGDKIFDKIPPQLKGKGEDVDWCPRMTQENDSFRVEVSLKASGLREVVLKDGKIVSIERLKPI